MIAALSLLFLAIWFVGPPLRRFVVRFRSEPLDVLIDLIRHPMAAKILVRSSPAAERVIDGMLVILAEEGITATRPRVVLTRRWVPAGDTLGMYGAAAGIIAVNSRLAVGEGHRGLRLTLGHELGHHIDDNAARSRLGVSPRVNDQIFAEAVGEYLCARRPSGAGVSQRHRHLIMRDALVSARRWRRSISRKD